jgi:hypothetical protein
MWICFRDSPQTTWVQKKETSVWYVRSTKGQAYSLQAIPFSGQGGYYEYIRTITERAQLKKTSLVVSPKGLDDKTNWLAVSRQSYTCKITLTFDFDFESVVGFRSLKESKIGSLIPWDSEQRVIVLTRTISNLAVTSHSQASLFVSHESLVGSRRKESGVTSLESWVALLDVATKQRLLKAVTAGDLECATVICRVWRLYKAL